jgi:putative endonuclease
VNFKIKIGDFGEDLCAKYLVHKGYKIIKTKYHCRYGEIDIIASNHDFLAFVEVKTRTVGSLILAAEAVNYTKINKIIKTAYHFLGSQNLNLQPRFDVCEIYIDKLRDKIQLHNINYIENAFNINDGNL